MPVETLPESQADAFARFLDALHIERAAVMGFSAGAPSALQFAIRYPQRVSALVLLSAAVWAPPVAKDKRQFPLPDAVYEWILNSDLVLWAAMKLALPGIEAAFGLSAEMQKSMTPPEREMISDFFHAMLPLSARREGILRDGPMVDALSRYPLEEVVPPTLVVSAHDDQVAPYEWGEYTAGHIPGAKFLLYEHGGHTLAGNHAAVNAEVTAFLRQHSQAAQAER
jgi:pimeloyl-ACP methyl ester carboxylesterase